MPSLMLPFEQMANEYISEREHNFEIDLRELNYRFLRKVLTEHCFRIIFSRLGDLGFTIFGHFQARLLSIVYFLHYFDLILLVRNSDV